DAEGHPTGARLMCANVRRGELVVEVRDAHTHGVAGRAGLELVQAARADAVAGGEGWRAHSHAIRLGAGVRVDAAVVEVVVGIVVVAAGALLDRVPGRLPDPEDVVARDGVRHRRAARSLDPARGAEAVGCARIARLKRRVVEHVAAAIADARILRA